MKGLIEMIKYFDKHGNQIQAGMFIRHNDGDVERVYAGVEDGELGINANNPNYPYPQEPKIYPLYQFDLSEWEIIGEDV